MSELLSLMWGIIGFIYIAAGKEFLETCVCFFICGIFLGCSELKEIRKELSVKEIRGIIEHVNKEEK